MHLKKTASTAALLLSLFYNNAQSLQNAAGESLPYTNKSVNQKEDSLSLHGAAPESALLLGIYSTAGPNDLLFGVEADLLVRTGKYSRTMLGFSSSYMIIGMTNYPGYLKHYTISMYNLGVRMAIRLGRLTYFTLNPSVILGRESYDIVKTPATNWGSPARYTTVENRLFTTQLSAGVQIQAPKQGLFTCIEFFGRGATSEVLDFNAGLRIAFGVKL